MTHTIYLTETETQLYVDRFLANSGRGTRLDTTRFWKFLHSNPREYGLAEWTTIITGSCSFILNKEYVKSAIETDDRFLARLLFCNPCSLDDADVLYLKMRWGFS